MSGVVLAFESITIFHSFSETTNTH